MYSARDNKGYLKVCLTLILKVNCEGQVTHASHFEISTSDMFKLRARMSLCHVYNP